MNNPGQKSTIVLDEQLVARLAGEAIDMFVEYRDQHGYPEDVAAHCAVAEMLDGYGVDPAEIEEA